MRIFGFSMLAALMTALPALAQNVAQPQAPAPETLDTVLRGWEKAMTELKSFACVIERKSLDKVLDATDHYRGSAMFSKDGDLARLELIKINNPKIFEKYICTGTHLHEYVSATNVVRVHKLPNAKQTGVQAGNILSFLFAIGTAQAKARFKMDLKKEIPPNPHYYSIMIRPSGDQDKADFTLARLVLYRSNNLPAEIWFRQANGNEVTWSFKELQVNVQIPPRYFQPEVPQGWEVVPVNAAPMVPNKKP